jgi:hypothetical protein
VDLQAAVLVDEAHLPESIHEIAHLDRAVLTIAASVCCDEELRELRLPMEQADHGASPTCS